MAVPAMSPAYEARIAMVDRETSKRPRDGFLEPHAGDFRPGPLADDWTRRQGTTWSSHDLWPATYWRWWLIHKIHGRALRYVKWLAEAS